MPPFRKSKKELWLHVWDGILNFSYDVCRVGVAKLFVYTSFVITSDRQLAECLWSAVYAALESDQLFIPASVCLHD